MVARNRWTDRESQILRKMYPMAPKKDVMKAFPNRSWKGIKHKARRLGISRCIYAMNANSSRLIREEASEFEKGYLLGLIEGEGSIYVTKTRSRGYLYFQPKLTIANTKLSVIQKAQEIMGGKIYKERRWGRRRDIWILQITTTIDVYNVLKALQPYFEGKRGQCDLMIRFCETKMESGGRSKPTREQAQICEELKKLNRARTNRLFRPNCRMESRSTYSGLSRSQRLHFRNSPWDCV